MGKIFGISDLPVTIFTTPLHQPRIPEAKQKLLFVKRKTENIIYDQPGDDRAESKSYKKHGNGFKHPIPYGQFYS